VDILVAMDTPEARKAAMAGTVEDWATESLLAARAAYQDPATGQRMKPGTKLADAYQEKALPVAKERLYRASMRLAMVLNGVFFTDALREQGACMTPGRTGLEFRQVTLSAR
jgi:hypothetical protein